MDSLGGASDASTRQALSDQIRSDLEWLLECPHLLDSDLNFDTDRFSLPADPNVSPAAIFLSGNCSHRLGYYFESLVQILLGSDDEISDLRHGIQIRENKETLGEVDFLFHRGGSLHHLEVALKYYLFSPETEIHGSRLLGPNARDAFERKRDRLFEKQLPLGKEQFPDVQRSHVLVKGAIFYPWRSEQNSPQVEKLSPDHRRGVWITDEQLNSFLSELTPDSRVAILSKPFWISAGMHPEKKYSPDDGILKETILARRSDERPVVLSVGREKLGCWSETERVFVVRNNWPLHPGS